MRLSRFLNPDRVRQLVVWWHGVLHAAMIDAASLLVPSAQRVEWRREWRGELWHVRDSCAAVDGVAWRRRAEVTAFCLGAFADAFWLAKAGRQPGLPFVGMRGTPKQCIAILGAGVVTSYAIALLLPGVQAERSLWPRKVNANLVTIEQARAVAGGRPSIEPRQYNAWTSRRQRYFDELAFYQVRRETTSLESASDGRRTGSTWGVAQASANLFAVMGLPLRFAEMSNSQREMFGFGPTEIVLSERAWKRDFGANPNATGTLVRLDGKTMRVAGVAPDGALGLPGHVDAWQLKNRSEWKPEELGYVVAHLTAPGQAAMWTSAVNIDVSGSGDPEDDLLGVSLRSWEPAPETVYLFGLFLALLALPAITSVSLGESSVDSRKISWKKRVHQTGFLGVKASLLLAIVYFVSLELSYGCATLSRESAVYIQLASAFALSLFGMRWVLKDQRQRCPVCLNLVVHPAQVGQASRTFLDWNGTEMMCMGGHTLLHVPSLPTSWFGAQRWLYLDASWDFLFAGSTRPAP